MSLIGILVDDSIVVLENIYHHLEKGEESHLAALRGRNEIGSAALSITLVYVVVFLPLSLISGIVGQIFRQYALVVVGATLTSLFVSFTVTPTLASRFAKLERLTDRTLLGNFALAFEKLYHRFSDLYQKTLKWSLVNKKKSRSWSNGALYFGAAHSCCWFDRQRIYAPDRSRRVWCFCRADAREFGGADQSGGIADRKILAQIPEINKIFTGVGAQESGSN